MYDLKRGAEQARGEALPKVEQRTKYEETKHCCLNSFDAKRLTLAMDDLAPVSPVGREQNGASSKVCVSLLLHMATSHEFVFVVLSFHFRRQDFERHAVGGGRSKTGRSR